MLENVARKPASTDLRGVLRQRIRGCTKRRDGGRKVRSLLVKLCPQDVPGTLPVCPGPMGMFKIFVQTSLWHICLKQWQVADLDVSDIFNFFVLGRGEGSSRRREEGRFLIEKGAFQEGGGGGEGPGGCVCGESGGG